MSSSYPTIHITTILRLGTNKFTQLFRNFPQHACNKRCLVLNIRKYPCSLQTTWLDTLNRTSGLTIHRSKPLHNKNFFCFNTGSNYFIPIRVQVKNNQSNAFKWKNNLQIGHNKNIRRYANCSSAKGMSLWRLNIIKMVVITWTYISAVSWLCDVYPHLVGFA